MNCTIRQWRPEDAAALAELLNNQKILDNLRDGIPSRKKMPRPLLRKCCPPIRTRPFRTPSLPAAILPEVSVFSAAATSISELPKSDIILEKTSGDTGSPPMP